MTQTLVMSTFSQLFSISVYKSQNVNLDVFCFKLGLDSLAGHELTCYFGKIRSLLVHNPLRELLSYCFYFFDLYYFTGVTKKETV